MLRAAVRFALAIGLVALSLTFAADSYSLKVINNAGAPIEVLWKNTFDGDGQSLQRIVNPVRNSTEVTLKSYDSHQFVIRFLKHVDGVEAHFTKSNIDEVVEVSFDETSGNLILESEDRRSKLFYSLEEATKQCQSLSGQQFIKCIASGALGEMTRIATSQTRLSKYRDAIAFKLRNYTCADASMPTTEPIETYLYNWTTGSNEERSYHVRVLFESDHAKIWSVENFVTEDECNTLERVGRPLLRRATVAAEDGTSIVSENRKAQQASYSTHQSRFEDDPLYDLHNRILALTNYHSNYTLTPEGQEGFTIIQYNPSDEYFPHCDGSCDGTPHVATGRVATAVMYCKEPEEGGATTFTKADIYVRPRRLAATFFSYLGPDGLMDIGFTEHSGCPILKGEKMITTYWMRKGVTAEEDWTKYDPSGIRILMD